MLRIIPTYKDEFNNQDATKMSTTFAGAGQVLQVVASGAAAGLIPGRNQ